MKRIIGLLSVMVAVLFFSGTALAADAVIRIFPAHQRVKFPMIGDRVDGLVLPKGELPPLPGDIAEGMEVSERVGNEEVSNARGDFDPVKNLAIIRNTCKADKALWAVKLKNGQIRFVNRDRIKIVYDKSMGANVPAPVKLANGQVRYGFFRAERVSFTEDRVMVVNFKNNRFTLLTINDKLVFDVNPADVEKAVWNTLGLWFDNAPVQVAPSKSGGNWLFKLDLSAMPLKGKGMVSIKFKSGSYAGEWAWLNIEKWLVSGAHSFVDTEYYINYDFNPLP